MKTAARGGHLGLLEAWDASRNRGEAAVLAVVTATSGSTYRKRGAMALLDAAGRRSGALSGGCFESELERRAREVLRGGRAAAAAFDTRETGDRVFGSGLGCRGRIETLLLPIPPDSRANPLVALERAAAEHATLRLALSLDPSRLGAGTAEWQGGRLAWGPGGDSPESDPPLTGDVATLEVPPPPELLLLGAGPETPVLLTFARTMGWRTTVVEPRRRFSEPARAAGADAVLDAAPAEAHAALAARPFDAVLVMTHNLDADLAHLEQWLPSAVPWIGLLGPTARRDELLAELGTRAEEHAGRLHAPVGIALGGRGPEAVALAVAAALQRHLTADDARTA